MKKIFYGILLVLAFACLGLYVVNYMKSTDPKTLFMDAEFEGGYGHSVGEMIETLTGGSYHLDAFESSDNQTTILIEGTTTNFPADQDQVYSNQPLSMTAIVHKYENDTYQVEITYIYLGPGYVTNSDTMGVEFVLKSMDVLTYQMNDETPPYSIDEFLWGITYEEEEPEVHHKDGEYDESTDSYWSSYYQVFIPADIYESGDKDAIYDYAFYATNGYYPD